MRNKVEMFFVLNPIEKGKTEGKAIPCKKEDPGAIKINVAESFAKRLSTACENNDKLSYFWGRNPRNHRFVIYVDGVSKETGYYKTEWVKSTCYGLGLFGSTIEEVLKRVEKQELVASYSFDSEGYDNFKNTWTTVCNSFVAKTLEAMYMDLAHN